jgi:hypothetical protein
VSDPHISMVKYAAHRAGRGLIGRTQVAVTKAVQSGRLSRSVVRDAQGKFLGVIPAIADQEWAASTDPAQQREVPSGGRPRQQEAFFDQGPAPSPAAGLPPNVGANFARARAIGETFKARLTELAWKEKSGQVVQADEVRREAARLGREVRNSILTTANNVGPELGLSRAMTDRLVRTLSAALGTLGTEPDA